VILAAVPALAAAAYQLLALVAALVWKRRPSLPSAGSDPPISVLKPLYGRDARLYRALRSHVTQDYPEFEILFGVRNPNDAALEDVERLRREFPHVPMRAIVVETDAANPKVGVLASLAAEARHPVLLINDDDMVVGPGYFQTVANELSRPGAGLVTCLYRAEAESLATRAEALGVATEFAPSVMVARLLGVAGFALGATMVMHAQTLRKIGGFGPIADYLADDYELGRRVAEAGYRVEFAPVVVETGLGGASWKEVWRHQVRWARTIRVSRQGGYYGSLITHTTFWALVALAAGEWQVAVAALALRLAAGWVAGALRLGDPLVKRWFWLMPLRDLFGLVVWAGGCSGSTVFWRGRKLRLTPDGRIKELPA
jgi:ceramide glucosyltransferase